MDIVMPRTPAEARLEVAMLGHRLVGRASWALARRLPREVRQKVIAQAAANGSAPSVIGSHTEVAPDRLTYRDLHDHA